MAKDQEAVRGRDFIVAPQIRSTRVRYEKTPLVPEPRGFWAAVRQLFGPRRMRPFAGSAVADEIDQGLNFTARVFAGDPHTSLAPGSTATEAVSGRLLAYRIEACTRADNALDQIDDELRQEELWLDQCRPESIVKSLRAALRDAQEETLAELRKYIRRLVEAQTHITEFRSRHGLDDDVRYGKHFNMGVIGRGLVLFGVEFLLNSLFMSGLLKDGLIGGLLFAGFTTVSTIAIGMMFGRGWQLRMQPFRRGGLTGYLMLAVALGIAFALISELSLIRLAGDAGDLEAIATASRAFSTDLAAGFRALSELPALTYAVFICVLISLVTYEFRGYLGDYPGYHKHGMRLEKARADVDQLVEAAHDEIRALGEDHKAKLEKAPDFIVSCKAPIRMLTADHENVIDQYNNDVDEIASGARLFDAFIAEYGEKGERRGELEQRVRDALATYGERLRLRHEAFLAKADELCSREDVSDETVDAARVQFTEANEAANEQLDANCAKVLDQARVDHHRNASWQPPSMLAAVPA